MVTNSHILESGEEAEQERMDESINEPKFESKDNEMMGE